MPTTVPYGSWPSPISAESTTVAGLRFADVVRVDGDDLYWVESRPEEGGRSVLVRRDAARAVADAVPADFNVRTRVHEYGGAAYAVQDGVIYAARFEDQRWYRIAGDTVEPITPNSDTPAALRYADPTLAGGWGIFVRESHTDDGGEPVNELVRVDLTGTTDPVGVVAGHDFFAAPRLSPDGTRLAWITWDHPHMPWDGSDLWLADIDGAGTVGAPTHIAGGPEESVLEPRWGPDGVLHFASDRTGWWNLYRLDGDGTNPIHPAEGEYAYEPWNFGAKRYGFVTGDDRIVALEEGPAGERMLILHNGESDEVRFPFASFGSSIAIAGATVYTVAHSFDRPSGVVGIDLDTGRITLVRVPAGTGIDPRFLSLPERITFDTPDGAAHALYYPPKNPDYRAPRRDRPPLIVSIHGGPTSRAGMNLSPERLFWTSRGFAIVDVDYSGSTGFGRSYRKRLEGQWGVVDVRDCALAARHCADRGLADPDRLLIHGGSAGGFTVLTALALSGIFAAGTASYAVTDLETLATDTHKFESRYLDSLIGPYPERRDLYVERSPTRRVSEITSPVLLLQGLEDRVVPPSQAEAMRDALIANGTPVAYLAFPGEGHGFRSADARVRALEAELWFYRKVLGLEADRIEGVEAVGL
jgi:dipeptidyl aminopeptidase/acylaminoacyl peptidase